MSTFHPESLRPSTLHTLAKSLKKALPDILGTPCALNQAQELLARTLGHPNWHAAIARAEQGAPALLPQPTPLSEPKALTGLFIRTLALWVNSYSVGGNRCQDLCNLSEEAFQLSPLLAPLSDKLSALADRYGQDSYEAIRDGLTQELMTLDRELALRFHAGCATGSFSDSLNDIAHRLPGPPEAWLTPDPLLPLGISLNEWRASWMRLEQRLTAHMTLVEALKQAHQVAHHPQWGNPADATLLQEWLTLLAEGKPFTEAINPSLKRLAAHTPYVAWATHMAVRSERGKSLCGGLVHLETARWLA